MLQRGKIQGSIHWQTIGVHNSVNLARESASRTAHVLSSIVCDAGSLLVHANN
jgi:hypothetical protein